MKRVLVTRAAHQASALAEALQARGLEVVSIPAIEIAPPTDGYRVLDAALQKLTEFDWVLFTSVNGVDATIARLKNLNLTMPPQQRIAVIGTATRRAVENAGWKVTLQPETAVAESLAEALLPYASDARILFIRAEQGRDTLPLILRRAGATLTLAAGYRSVLPESSIALMQQQSESFDAVCFTSSSSVLNLVAILERAGVRMREDALLASIGPVTTSTLMQLGLRPQIETSVASVEALADAVARYFKR